MVHVKGGKVNGSVLCTSFLCSGAGLLRYWIMDGCRNAANCKPLVVFDIHVVKVGVIECASCAASSLSQSPVVRWTVLKCAWAPHGLACNEKLRPLILHCDTCSGKKEADEACPSADWANLEGPTCCGMLLMSLSCCFVPTN